MGESNPEAYFITDLIIYIYISPPSILKASDPGQFKICSITEHFNQFAHKSPDTHALNLRLKLWFLRSSTHVKYESFSVEILGWEGQKIFSSHFLIKLVSLTIFVVCVFLGLMILPGVSCVLITNKKGSFLVSVLSPPAQCLAFKCQSNHGRQQYKWHAYVIVYMNVLSSHRWMRLNTLSIQWYIQFYELFCDSVSSSIACASYCLPQRLCEG